MNATIEAGGCCDINRPDTAMSEGLLQTCSPESVDSVLARVLEKANFSRLRSFLPRLYICMDIFMAARGFSREIGVSDDRFVKRFGTVEDIEPRLSSTESMVDFMRETLTQCVMWRIENARDSGCAVMLSAKDYVDRCYMDVDISLKTVADAVGLSPSYLSMLFKKEIGLNLSEYITRVRVERSKELLCCTSKMIYEVAYEVGFHDYRYFSQIFKKHTGMTPRQFQNSANLMPVQFGIRNPEFGIASSAS